MFVGTQKDTHKVVESLVFVGTQKDTRKVEDVAREDHIFLREGAEMAMAKRAYLPKEEYAKLVSTIMTRQHTYRRPPFDYAKTFDNFYVYDYLGDGDSIINFAIPIIGNEDLITNIEISIDNGTITDTRGLDLYAENLQGKQRVNYRRFADAFKKRHGNRGYGVTFRGDSASNGGTYFEDSKRIGGDATTRGTSGNIDESANQELTTRFSLITPEMDASYLDAVNRGDMVTAQRMVMEAAKLAMPNTKVVDEVEFIQALRAFVSLFPQKVKRDYSVDKVVTEETFGGIWIEDTEEFAKFVSAVNNSPFEEDGEGIAKTSDYLYLYYRGIDEQVIPFASVYLNKGESQSVANELINAWNNGEKGKVREYIDGAYEVARYVNVQGNILDGTDKELSATRGNDRLGSELSQLGRYYYAPEFYCKVKRADSGSRGQGKVVYSLIIPEMDATYLDAVERGDMVTAQEVTRFMLPDPDPM